MEINYFDLKTIRENAKIAIIDSDPRNGILKSLIHHFSGVFESTLVFTEKNTDNLKICNNNLKFCNTDDEVENFIIQQKINKNINNLNRDIVGFKKIQSLLICDSVNGTSDYKTKTKSSSKNNASDSDSDSNSDSDSDSNCGKNSRYNTNKILDRRAFSAIMKLSRHWDMLFIYSIQQPHELKPTHQYNFDYIFIMNIENDEKKTRLLYENLGGTFKNYNQFSTCINLANTNGCGIVIDNVNRYKEGVRHFFFINQVISN